MGDLKDTFSKENGLRVQNMFTLILGLMVNKFGRTYMTGFRRKRIFTLGIIKKSCRSSKSYKKNFYGPNLDWLLRFSLFSMECLGNTQKVVLSRRRLLNDMTNDVKLPHS